MNHTFRSRVLKSAALFGLLCTSTSALAAGFSLLEQSAEGVGVGFAGATAGYGDGSEIYYNPAAMGGGQFKSTTLTLSSHIIAPKAQFSNQGSTINPKLGGSPLVGDNGPDGGETAILPNIYMVYPINEKFTFGLGLNSPWGLATEYDRSWVGRYHAVRSELTTININPALSYNVDDNFSIGAGLQAMYVDAKLSNMIDFGTVGVAALGFPTAAKLGLLPQKADGFGEVTGDDWAMGFSLGAAYRYCENNRIGLSFRSRSDVKISGDAKFEVPSAALPLTAGGFFKTTGVKADITLPETVSLGGIHWVSDNLGLLGEVQWMNWSTFDELRIKYANGQPDTAVDESWNDTWRFSAGAMYKLDESWMLKGGYTHDQTPVPDKFHRTARIPDNDRDWLALGVGYEINPSWSLDASYAHLFMGKSSTSVASSTGDVLNGDWKTSVDMFSAQLSYRFS